MESLRIEYGNHTIVQEKRGSFHTPSGPTRHSPSALERPVYALRDHRERRHGWFPVGRCGRKDFSG